MCMLLLILNSSYTLMASYNACCVPMMLLCTYDGTVDFSVGGE